MLMTTELRLEFLEAPDNNLAAAYIAPAAPAIPDPFGHSSVACFIGYGEI
jgi:hypothetical protein